MLRLTPASEAEGRRFEFCLGHHLLPSATYVVGGELILVEHYIDKTLNERPAEPRTNRESEIERKAEQR